MSKRIVLIPVDKSEYSEKAVKWANEHLLRPNDFVVLCHVYFMGMEPSARRPERSEAYCELEKVCIKEGKDLVHEMGKFITVSDQKEMLILEGDAREILEETIKKYNVNVVVIGSRGLGSVKGMFLGSVSSYISQHSPVPVVVVH